MFSYASIISLAEAARNYIVVRNSFEKLIGITPDLLAIH